MILALSCRSPLLTYFVSTFARDFIYVGVGEFDGYLLYLFYCICFLPSVDKATISRNI